MWQLRAEESLLRISSSLPYGKRLPSDEVTTTRLYWAGLTHSGAFLKKYKKKTIIDIYKSQHKNIKTNLFISVIHTYSIHVWPSVVNLMFE